MISMKDFLFKVCKRNEYLLRFYKKLAVPYYKKKAANVKVKASEIYRKLFQAEWCIDNPEYFDHDIDLYYQWGEKCIPYWLERGIYNILALKMFQEPILIELCCGEGFNSKYFYSTSCKIIYACDFDDNAIKEAKIKYQRDNIDFAVADIRYDIPEEVHGEKPTNIIWDAAIEHFTPKEIDAILRHICNILSEKNGILSGYTIKARGGGYPLNNMNMNLKIKRI